MDSFDLGKERHREPVALTLRSLSLVDLRQGRFQEARENALRALRLFVDASALVSIPEALNQVGLVEAAFGRWRKAARLLAGSQALAESQSVPLESKSAPDRVRAEVGCQSQLDPAEFAAECELGRAMEMEEALQYAFESSKSDLLLGQKLE
jgi:hypothetical protein